MLVPSRASSKKSWQTSRERVSVQAALAIQRENVMQRLLRLRAEIGHPEKAGEPLPQDQAAARAGVTARQWQRWESGKSVPYARNLSAVADAFEFDVGEFYDGPAGREPASTPDPFPPHTAAELEGVLREIKDQLAEQTRVLDEIKAYARRVETLLTEQQEAKRETQEATERLLAAAETARQALRPATQSPAPTRGTQAT